MTNNCQRAPGRLLAVVAASLATEMQVASMCVCVYIYMYIYIYIIHIYICMHVYIQLTYLHIYMKCMHVGCQRFFEKCCYAAFKVAGGLAPMLAAARSSTQTLVPNDAHNRLPAWAMT